MQYLVFRLASFSEMYRDPQYETILTGKFGYEVDIFNDVRHGGIAAHFQVIIERGILSFMTGYTLISTTI